jgi:Cu+-exporting ATPase
LTNALRLKSFRPPLADRSSGMQLAAAE